MITRSILLLFIFMSSTLFAQQEGGRYLPSKLYDRGGYEVHLFNNYFTQGQALGRLKSRYDFFTSDLQFLYGLSTKLNIGLDIKLRSVAQTLAAKDPTFRALKWSNKGRFNTSGATGYARSGWTAIGLRWKLAPIASIPNFSIQQTVYIPTKSDLEGSSTNGFLDWSGYSFHTQLYYDHNVSSKVSLFVESDLIIENIGKAMFGKAVGYYQYSTPVSIILSYFPNSTHTIYGLINAAPQWGTSVQEVEERGIVSTTGYSPYNQYGLGYKYALSHRILAEVIWTRFFNSTVNTKIYTYNFGIRYFVNK